MNTFWEKIQVMFKYRPDTEGTEWHRLSFQYWTTFFVIVGLILLILIIFQILR